MKVKTGLKVGKALGDLVGDATQATGLDKVAAALSRLTGLHCGCEERKAALNRLVPRVPLT
ncbi:MAG: hypothetical protein HY675_27390 [Chloroflexi bacterium]|nr:hypothetical protein [Chloroflexota bacterium]